ncbi:MAG TPA: lamin tail domain-containing protein, partial [Saprospiraceae bacterium]|nr:lamin tail domain-containing protein [Saprospiraceae bacterium]
MNLRYLPIFVLFFLFSSKDLLVSQSCSDLYISEYIEGSSNNKCIELYNPTTNSIDLSADGYALKFFFNGNTSAGTTINLSGNLAAGDVFIVCDNDATVAFLAQADQTSTSTFYNGDDAILLLKGTDTLDIIGVIGVDPGSAWTGSSASTANQTLVRRPGVKSGILTNPASFDPSVEWISNAQDFTGNLGAHYQDPCPCTELYFSEYLEGSSNNKALEIYNPTADCVDLTAYTVYRFNNGSSTATDSMHFNQMLCPGEVYVIANPSADATILNVADTTHTVTFINGDDAIVLSRLTQQIDIIGIVGVDPGTNWPVGSGATSEYTLIRMSTVNSPTIDWSLGSTQWDVFPQNSFDSLGAHFQNACSLTCDSMVVITEGMDPCSGSIDALSYGLYWYIQTTQPVLLISSTHGASTMQIAPDTILVSMMNIPSGEPASVVLVGGICGDTLRLRDSISCDVCDFILPPNAGDETFCGDPSPTVVPSGGGFPALKVTSDLFFSEYTEGSGFNKCLELFNGTGQIIDLASGLYTIDIYFNGNTIATSHVDLTGMIPDQGTFVICDNGANMAFQSLADQIDNDLSFNGDDAITLSHNGVIIDVIGQIGVDPGSQWGSGVQSTADNTLIRRSTIFKGDENPVDPFLPATEWDGFAIDDMADLGMHTYSAMDTLPEYYNFYDGDPAMGGLLIGSGPSLSVSSGANDSTIYVTAVSMGCESAAMPLTFRSLQVESPSCQDLVHISLNTGCERQIVVEDVLSGAYSCSDAFDLILATAQGNTLSIPEVTLMDVGSSFTYRIRNRYDGATCWGTIQIEKKFPPLIECSDVTISCTDSLPLAPVPLSCDPFITTRIHNQTFTHEDCESRFTGYYDRTIHVEDAWGNQQSCSQRIWVEKANLDDLRFPEDAIIECLDAGLSSFVTSTLDDQGYFHPIPYLVKGINIGLVEAPSIDGNYLDPRIDHCNIITFYNDIVLPACGKTYTIRRNWIVKDWCTGEEQTDVQYIRIVDTLAPRFEQFKDPEVTYNIHDCKAAGTFSWPEIKAECSGIPDLKWRYEMSYVDPQHPGKEIAVYGEVAFPDPVHVYLPFGKHDIRFEIRDACENDTVFHYRLIIQDELPPEPVCDEITQVTLDPEKCWARVYAKDLDDGSHDACCDRLHFAVASMDTITYWRDYWQSYFAGCLDPYDYHHYQDDID